MRATTYTPELIGERRDARALLGQVMGYVAIAIGFAALGAYLGRDLDGGAGILFLLVTFADVIALSYAAAKGRVQLALGLLFTLGLLLGLGVAPLIADYASNDPSALWQAAGATAVFTAGLGACGLATSRDLSGLARAAFWALLALLVFGIVALFVAIPGAHVIYSVVGLVIFGAFTVIDFNRVRNAEADNPVLIAASIFLDVFNVFVFFVDLFGGSRD